MSMKLPIFRRIKRWLSIIIPSLGAIFLFVLIISNNKTGVGSMEITCLVPILFIFLSLFWLFYFSQFIVPLTQWLDRLQIFIRTLLLPSPLHGQAVYIQDGKVHQTAEELDRHGVGTAVLDTTSAALLETPVDISRAIGPGVTFLGRRETLGPCVNIRPRKSFLGPFEKDPSPFAPRLPDESNNDYDDRMRRRLETRALTRDNNEVIPNIFIKFRLDAIPGTGNTPFGFNPAAVEAALISRNINTNQPKDSKERLNDWDWLPGKLAADVWRELLPFFFLVELFKPVKGDVQGRTGLVILNNILSQRLTQPVARSISRDPAGNIAFGPALRSNEYHLLLARGIRVNVCTVLNLRFTDSIENSLVQDWATSWLQLARANREQSLSAREAISVTSRQTARATYSQAVIGQIPSSLPANYPGQRLLNDLLAGGQGLFMQNSQLPQIAGEERQALADMLDWGNSNEP